ncbi:hypothetical protein AVEN_66871-1 [Araneus ventricosus]|uniref:Uncharacterized protein n=1 Tax=Araneus ventricosus TaxID=182803 RepID=A0A4Y2UWG0_ARAVE|nr:hypothetical protein AVEN_66871-1 [Araneus ventricosus]
MTRMAPRLIPLSPNFHTTSMMGFLTLDGRLYWIFMHSSFRWNLVSNLEPSVPESEPLTPPLWAQDNNKQKSAFCGRVAAIKITDLNQLIFLKKSLI